MVKLGDRLKEVIRKILYIFILLFTSFSFSQLSKTHYIPPLTHAAEGNANAVDQWIYISTPSTSPVNVSILPVGGTAQTITVQNNQPQKFQVSTNGYSQLYVEANTTSRVMNNKGYNLVGCNITGSNAFFVKKDLISFER